MIARHRRSLVALVSAGCCVLFVAASPDRQGAAPPAEPRRLEVMFFGAPTANGAHHDPITRYAVLKKALGSDGINLTYSDEPAVAFRPDTLARFDAVLMYGNWLQNEPMPKDQLQALLAWVERGGGFVPVHCASACYGGSPEFVKLVGARFATHGGEEFQVRDVLPEHPILEGLSGFTAWDETYVHSEHAADREILQVRDREPWSWTRRQGKGRVFYTASGHDHRVWDLPAFQQLLRNAIYWVVGPERRQQLAALALPVLEQERVSLPGYRERQEITMAQKPLSAAESMKLAQVPPGMRLALFASEPDIVNPIHVAFDHRGRAFVVETIDYPNNLHRDDLGHDRITICEDSDGDGRADRFTRFAEHLSIPTSLVFVDGGLLCTNGSEVLFLADTDGDDRADVRKVVLSGFHMGDTHAGISNLRYGFDGWIYATVGYSGFTGDVGGEHLDFYQGLLRCRADGSKLEFLQNTTNNTWGLGFTEEFDIVGSTANANPSWYFTHTNAEMQAVGLEPGPTPRADDNPRFFPMSTDIRQVDQFDRYTAGAGHTIYTARRLPEAYWNKIAFVCEPTGKLVGQFELVRDGAGFRAQQLPNNLYDSADAWSSPVCAEVGPDGAVWICDWYNLIVQHNPTPTRASAGVDARTGRGGAYETPLRDTQHGRIYRVFPAGSPDAAVPRLDAQRPETLLAGLGDANMLFRLHAQRLLTERGDRSLAPRLAQLVRADGAAAPHALEVLYAQGALDTDLMRAALASPHTATRRRAIALANPAELKDAYVAGGTVRAAGRELADVLDGLAKAANDPEIGAALHGLAVAHEKELFADRTLREAWQIASRHQAEAVLRVAAAAGTLTEAPSEPENLLPNPDFAAVTRGVPDGWGDLRVYGGARGKAVQLSASQAGRGGGSCLCIHSDAVCDCGAAATIAVQPRTRYRLSGFVRTEDLVPARGSPGAMFNVHGGRRTKGVRGTADWTDLAVEFETDSEREIVVHCLFGGYGGAVGTAYFDDVSLVEIGSGQTLAGALRSLATHAANGTAAPAAKVRRFPPDVAVHERGAAVYNRTCIACHGVDGRGVPQAFPPLDGSDWLCGAPQLPARIVLHGLYGQVTVGTATFFNVMAPLGPLLSDQEIADVLTYARQRWSNDAAAVDVGEVQRVRAATKERTSLWTAAELGR
ncbi:MAG TPA: PVC-type heme-binding CxxCH protein [Planctomycetota bacterium]|nr:PVC-type heme-binding CxxCH protein [Planctomycetota bacterium]